MVRNVVFNGVTKWKPGGITRINAEALNQVTLSENSIVALLGEADGGAPGSEGLVTLFDPSRATEMYRSGPLVDAIRLAFQSSSDAAVPGGASRVLVYKTNASTAATLSLPGKEATEVVTSTATGGTTTTLVDTSLTSTVDDQYNGMWMVLRPFTATAEVRRITDYVAGTTTFTVDTAFTGAATAADDYIVLEDELERAGTVDAGATSTSVPLKAVTDMVASEHVGRWVYIQDSASQHYVRQITANTTSSLTVAPALPAAPTTGAFVEILPNVLDLTSKDWGVHTNGISVDVAAGTAAGSRVFTASFEGEDEISMDVGGGFVLSVLFRGGTAALSDTAALGSTTSVIELTGGGLTPSAHVGTQVLINDEYTVITANTASQLTVSPELSAAPGVGDDVLIQTVTAGTMEVSGSAGQATSWAASLTGVVGADLTVNFSAGQTLRDLMNAINANVSYVASAAPGVNPDTLLLKDLDFGPSTSSTVLVSADLAEEGLTDNVAEAVSYFDGISAYVSATRSADTGSAVAGLASLRVMSEFSGVSMSGGARGVSSNSSFQAGMDALLLVRANSVVPLVDQDLANEGYGSTATVASVGAQLVDHVTQARGVAQGTAGERGGFIGVQGTKDAVIAFANSINDTDVAVVAQNPTVLNAAGSLTEQGPRMLAVMAASMRAGVSEIGEPLTHKYLRVSGMSQDASWDPSDVTDANDLIINGILFAETISGKGTRWVRDLTSHVKDDNLAYMEGSVRDVVRAVAYGLRETLVDRYTGKKAKPATIASIKDTAVSYLELARGDSLIVDSTDPATGKRVKAYHNLKVTSSGDVVRVNVGIFPVPGINFILNDIFLQLPTQSA